MITGTQRVAFGLTEPDHGSDATWLETRAVRDGRDWVIDGEKRFNSGLHHATLDIVFARTSGEPGDARGISAFLVPTNAPGFEIRMFHWTFNMPTDHAEVRLTGVRVPESALLHEEGEGLTVAQLFVHENRIRQAASGVGVAQYCIDESVAYARQRKTFGEPLATRQAIQFPLAELHTECELVRGLVYKTAWNLDRKHHLELSEQVSMANYRANRLACNAADLAMQVHGGIGYTRHKPFEHIYRHHRRYRITEGSDEIQLRKIAGHLFGFMGARAADSPRGNARGPVAVAEGRRYAPAPLGRGPHRASGRTRSMAKLSQVLRDQRRKKLIAKHKDRRAELRAKLRDPNVSMEEKFQVQKAFAKLPRNSCPTRLKRRCGVSGRARSNYRKFGISRIAMRDLTHKGQLPGMRKSSW